jgi:hypothetical protein
MKTFKTWLFESFKDNFGILFKNEDFLNNLRSLSVNVSIPPKASTHSGAYGQVYFLGDKVIKLTRNKKEYDVSQVLKQKCPNEVAILGSFIVNQDIFCIVQKKLEMSNSIIDHPAYAIRYYITNKPKLEIANLIKTVSDNQIYQYLKDNIKTNPQISFYIDRIETEEQMNYLIEIWQMIKNIYFSTGFIFTDLKSENIGIDNGKLKLFDFDEFV